MTAPLGIALIGGGIFMKEQHVPAALACPQVSVKAVWSRSAKSAEETVRLLADAGTNAEAYSSDSGPGKSYDDLLKRADIAGLILALPIVDQPSYIEKALAAGKHVLAEKPIAKDLDTATKLIEYYKKISAENNTILAIAENFRFMKGWGYAAEEIRKLGRVTGFVVRLHSMMEASNKYYKTPWRTTPEHQGGFLLDGGVHYTAALRKLLGQDDAVTSVIALTSLITNHLPPKDTINALLQTKSGVLGSYSQSMGTSFKAFDFHVACEHGYVEAGSDKVVTVKGVGADATREEKTFEKSSGVKEEVQAWAEAMISGTPHPEQAAELALGDLELLEKMLTSGDHDGARQQLEYHMNATADIASSITAPAAVAIPIPELEALSIKEPSTVEAPKTKGESPTPAKPPSPPSPPCYFDNGLRRVAPYHYTYNTWCKERWRGREVLDIFESEFRDRPLAYYKHAIETGQVCVDGKIVSPDHIVKNGSLVSHTIHRHEPPVSAAPIGILHEDDDMIVINKPSGIPVHPAGRYNYNSVIEIMKAERGPEWIAYPCNRLDRLTSGIMFIAKHPKSAESLSKQIKQRSVRKEYIARVIGNFPDGEVVCNQPILQISPKLGLNRIRADGKSARTVFKKLAYYPPRESRERPSSGEASGEASGSSEALAEEKSRPWIRKEGYSIVRCLPVTGRTHQLRVHLQHLGHPIQNDPIYANQKVWGINLGFNDPDALENTDEDIISRLNRMGKDDVADAVAYHDAMVDQYYKRKAEKMSGELCEVCDTPLYTDPGAQELSLWLHSLRYEDAGGSWSYVSPLPDWALPPSGHVGPTEVGGLDELVDAVKDENPELAN
ncbi:pseudouridine synthase [Xylaria palmicola]|nr:pseudouridine synthase [Xylaria palmicola]